MHHRLRKEQAGFRPGRGTVEQIFIVHNILEQSMSGMLPHTFILLTLRRRLTVEDHESIGDSRQADRNGEGAVRWIHVCSDQRRRNNGQIPSGHRCEAGMFHVGIPVSTGHQVGDEEDGGRTEDFTRLLEDIDYTDDLLLLTSRVDHMQEKTARLEENAGRVGLKLNPQKCKWMKVNSRNSEGLRVRDSLVEEVNSFTYLEAQVTRDKGGTLDIKRRTALAYASFNRVNKIWSTRVISRNTKVTLFKTLVLSVLLYSCDTWKLTKGEEKKLDTFQAKCFRRMLRIRWQQHVKNKEVLEMAGAEPISVKVRR